MIPGNKDTSTEDLYFKEYEQYVHRALHGAGFTKSEGAVLPDEIIIFLSYGVSDPQKNISSSTRNVYGVTGYTKTTDWGYGTQNTARYEKIGKTTDIATHTTFTRWMILDAYDAATISNESKLKPAWKTSVTSTGRSRDLRRVLPALAGASIYYIGKNTGTQVAVTVREDNDPDVLYVKGIQQQ